MFENPLVPRRCCELLSGRQAQFLAYEGREAMYGGAAGGGKSVALLVGALQFAAVPGYHALLLRRTFKMLEKPGALIDLSKEWLTGKAGWSEQKHRWTFPSGATLTFGHMEHAASMYDYQGAAFAYVGYDELSQFEEKMYKYLFSRTRRRAGDRVPVRMRSASNPDGVGHAWVKARFIDLAAAPERLFVPARIDDNLGLDREEYVASLNELDPVTRAQLLAGDWDAYEAGRFRVEWFGRFESRGPDGPPWIADTWLLDTGATLPRLTASVFVTCDPAATAKTSSDFTVIGVFAAGLDGRLLVLEVVRERMDLEKIVPTVADVCKRWRPAWLGIEAVTFQAGLLAEARRHPDVRCIVTPLDPCGKDKLTRATPAILLAEQGRVHLPRAARWLDDFEGELRLFTGDEKVDAHDDQVDVLAYAVQLMKGYGPADDLPAAGAARFR